MSGYCTTHPHPGGATFCFTCWHPLATVTLTTRPAVVEDIHWSRLEVAADQNLVTVRGDVTLDITQAEQFAANLAAAISAARAWDTACPTKDGPARLSHKGTAAGGATHQGRGP